LRWSLPAFVSTTILLSACTSPQAVTRRGVEPVVDGGEEIAPPPPKEGGMPPSKEAGIPPLIMLPDAGLEAGNDEPSVLVYAQSGSDLFQVDPVTLKLSRVGPLLIPMPDGKVKYLNTVADIAIDRNGRILGVTYDALLEIDPATAECKTIAPLPSGLSFNGLSFIRAESGDEALMATTLQGTLHRIDPQSGEATLVGAYGEGLQSSGDIVSVSGYGTLGTLKGDGTDQLARIDTSNGKATIIGPIGFSHVWGIGFWKDKVFGFTDRGEFVLIDPETGSGTLVDRDSSAPFWGAGVTTSVPVVIN
jgi:hypothetical protein